MNVGYKIIWNGISGTWVVVSENTKSKGKSTKSRCVQQQIAALGSVLLLHAGAAYSVDIIDTPINTSTDHTPGIAAHSVGDVINMYDSSGGNTGNSSITTSGFSSHAVSVTNGAQVTLRHTDLTASGFSAKGISVAGAGSSVVMHGGSVSALDHAVAVNNGGSAYISDSTLSSSNGYAAYASGGGASVTLSQVSIAQEGGLLAALQADHGASLHITGSTISTNGTDGTGVNFVGSAIFPATIGNLIDTSIKTGGSSSHGVQVSNGNTQVNLHQVNIVTQGSNSSGIFMSGDGASMSITDTAIHTYGNAANGVVNFGGAMDVNGVSIITEGNSAHGLYASNNSGSGISQATYNANNVDVTTHGNAYGAIVREGAEMTISNSRINSHGDKVAAVRADGIGDSTTKLTLDGVQLNTTGINTHGIYATNAAQVQANNVGIYTTGNDSNAVHIVNDAAVTLNNLVMQSELADGLTMVATRDGINNAIAVNNTTITARSGSALSVNGGSADLNLINSQIDAATVIHVSDNVINNADGSTTTIVAGTNNLNFNTAI